MGLIRGGDKNRQDWNASKILNLNSSKILNWIYLTKLVEIGSSGRLLKAPGTQGKRKVDQKVNGKQDPNGKVCCQKELFKIPHFLMLNSRVKGGLKIQSYQGTVFVWWSFEKALRLHWRCRQTGRESGN